MADEERKKVDVSVDKVTIKNLAMGGLLGGGGECFVDVKDGKAIRIRPYKYDWKYDFESLRPWTITRNGETLSPLGQGAAGAVLAGLQEAHLLPQPHQVPDEARRLGSQRRAQHAEPWQEQVRADLLGRGDRHHRRRDHSASTRTTVRSPSWPRVTATARTRPSTRPTAIRPACST